MKAYLAIVIIILAIGFIIFLSFSANFNPLSLKSSHSTPTQAIIQGTITDIASDNTSLSVLMPSAQTIKLKLSSSTQLADTDHHSLTLSDLHRGFSIQATGTIAESGNLITNRIKVTHMPAIIIYNPTDNSTVTANFTIDGIARVFENVVSLSVQNASTGKVLFRGTTQALAPDTGAYGIFTQKVTLYPSDVQKGNHLEITAYQVSPKDGTKIDTVTQLVSYDTVAHVSLTIFLTNDNLNPQADCSKVFSITRDSIISQTPAKDALTALLEGPTDEEVIQGYGTALPDALSLKSIAIKDGEAKVMLSSQLRSITNTCRRQAIDQQITNTLLQFPNVAHVSIASE